MPKKPMVETHTRLHIRTLHPHELPLALELLEAAGMYTTSVTLESGPDYRVQYGLGELQGTAQPVGVLGLEQMRAAGGATLMRSFTVREKWRGQGFSAQFIAWAEAQAKAMGHRELLLFTEPKADITAYWQHLGFARIPPAELTRRAPMLPQARSAVEAGWLEDGFAFQREVYQLHTERTS